MAKNTKTQLIIEGKDDTKKAFASVDKGLLGISKSAAKAGAAIAGAFAVATAGVVAKLVKDSIDAADALSKMAAGAGVTTESLSGMGWAAGQSGIELNALATAMGRLNKGALEASQGTGTYAKVFDSIGVSATNASGQLKNADELLLELADIFESMPDGAEKSAIALELFGRSGAQMIPFLNAGASGIKELTAQAERLGLVINQDQASAAEQFNDNLSILAATSKGVGNALAADLLPPLNELTGLLVDIAEDGESVNAMAETMAAVMKGLAVVAIVVGASFQSAGSMIGALAASVAALVSGDFKGAANIMKMGLADYEKTVRTAVERIQKLTDGTYQEEGKERARLAGEKRRLADQEKAAEALRIAELKTIRDKELAENKSRNTSLLAEEKKYLSELEKLKEKSTEINNKYNETRSKLSGSGGSSDPSYGDANALKAQARSLLQAGDFENARKAAEEARQMLEAMAAAGQNTYGLVGFANELEKIEQDSVDAEVSIAEEKLANIKLAFDTIKAEAAQLENMPVTIELDQQSVDTVKTQIQSFADDLKAKAVIPFTVATGGIGTGDTLPAFASGGHVRGAGTGRSDSILARLSNGEFVMRADAVKKYGTNLLNNMNGMNLPKFADGGVVGSVAGMQQQQQNIGTLQFNLPSGDSFSVDVAGTSEIDSLHRAALKFGRTRR